MIIGIIHLCGYLDFYPKYDTHIGIQEMFLSYKESE